MSDGAGAGGVLDHGRRDAPATDAGFAWNGEGMLAHYRGQTRQRRLHSVRPPDVRFAVARCEQDAAGQAQRLARGAGQHAAHCQDVATIYVNAFCAAPRGVNGAAQNAALDGGMPAGKHARV